MATARTATTLAAVDYGGGPIRAVLAGRAADDVWDIIGELREELLRRMREEGLPKKPDGLDVFRAPHDVGYLLFRLREPIPGYQLLPGQGPRNPIDLDTDASEELRWVLYRELTGDERADLAPELVEAEHLVVAVFSNDEFLERGGISGIKGP